MEKKRCFLGFLASLFVIFLTGHALAEGYTCPEFKQYTGCNAGYYLNGSDAGNACVLCSTANNTTDTETKSRTCTDTEKNTLHATACTTTTCTKTCNGTYTGGNAGSNGVSQCTGCSSFADCTAPMPVATSCMTGYYFSDDTCNACSDLNNTAQLGSTDIDGGKRIQTCTGKYTGGAGGTSGSSACTGCSAHTYTCSCNSGYHASGTGETCTCELDCSTSKECSTLGSDWSGTYNECTGDQGTKCSKSCSVACSGNATSSCPANAEKCAYDTSHTYSGTQYYGGSCGATAGTCPLQSFTCKTGYKTDGNTCKPEVYNITYNLDGGTKATSGVPTSYTYGVGATINGVPTKTGSTFAGWCTDASKASCAMTQTISTTTTGNKTFYAKWTLNNYTITYKNGGGTGSDQTQQVTYNAKFTTKAGNIFTKPGFTFKSWGGSYPNPNSEYTYTTAGNTTLTAQWNACSANTGAAGTCNCGSTQYPNGSGCANCSVSCSGVTGFTLGNYNVCNSQTNSICYRNCTKTDIPNSANVGGTVTKGGTNTCYAQSCASGYFVSGNGCAKLPEGGKLCEDGTSLCCNTGYTKSDDGLNCNPNKYTVTYSCGEGGGTKPANGTATYNAGFTPANNTCTRADWQFNGWAVSGTTDTKSAGASFTWLYLENKTFTAQWIQTAGNCTTGEYYDAANTKCQTCPDGYTSDLGATSKSQCYKQLTTACTDPGVGNDCPANSSFCWFLTDTMVECKQYYNSSTCVPIGSGVCPVDPNSVSCNANYYNNSGACSRCSEIPGSNGTWNESVGGSEGVEVCYNACTYDCEAYVNEYLTPEHATCQPLSHYINGGKYYPSSVCEPRRDLSCSASSCTCEDGYEFKMPTGTDGDIGSCEPLTFAITLNVNGGSGSNTTIYQKYTVGWFSNEGATAAISKAPIPTRENWSFLGYYTAATGGEMIIDANGVLPANNKYTATATLYAHWSQNFFTCTAGKTSTGATCPAGSYCPGGNVPAGSENGIAGCTRTCPADAKGGNVTSAAGSNDISACQTTRKNVALDDNSGAADQSCNYSTSSSAYDNKCTIKITSCNPGNYRQSENATTCASCEVGAYCPGQELNKYLCSALPGANATTTTKGTNSSDASACYNTCDSIEIPNGVRTPNNTEVYFSGSTIPACTYTTMCNTGYDVSGETCVPHVYTITLNHNGGQSSTNAIYLKYGDGWYSAKAATGNKLLSVTKPDLAGKTFSGYVSTDGTVVIDANGKLTTNTTVFHADTTIKANWDQNSTITCVPGTYYKGTGTTCTDCPAGSYCTGTTAIQDIRQESGKATCVSLNGSYTTASGLTTTISSAPKAESSAACYATNLAYTSPTNTGSGSQTCYYDASRRAYSNACENKTILSCIKGHWRKNTDDVDCTEVGLGYYSPDKAVTRSACPNLDTTDGVTTQSTTSEKVTQCYLGNIWYEPANGHSGHRRSCYHIENAAETDINKGYSYNCDVSVIVVCDAGYWDDGTSTNATGERDCVPVGNNYFSPEQAFYTDEPAKPNQTAPGSSTKRTACPDNGLTSTTTASRNTACYKACPVKTIENGSTTANPATVQYTGTQYPACTYVATCDAGFTSATGTTPTENPECGKCREGYFCPSDGNEPEQCPAEYPKSDIGSTNQNQCYRECELAENAATMSGKDYLGGSTCTIATCKPGSYLQNDSCVICPAGKVCNGGTEGPEECPADHYCSSGTDEPQACPPEFPNSAAGTTAESACYRECVVGDVNNATSVSGTVSKGGVNKCVATACAAGTYLEDGGCVQCPAGKACNGGTDKPTDCPEGSYCEGGTDTPTQCPASHPKSHLNTTTITGCYQECTEYQLDGGTAIPKAPTASYPAVCEYTGKSDTGNPCEIVGDKCVETHCNSDYELINGRCRPCDRENALSYKPQGNCMVASCVTGYHPNGQKCDENVRECPAPNATLAQQTWDFSKNAFSTCTIVECESGYHIASNACVLDERECVVEHGIGTQEWNSASNSWGECIATQCDPGYTNDPYETNERTKQCGQCKNKFSVLGEQAASTYIQGCEIASCMYQGELYNLENNECVPICSIEGREDETGTMKWDPSRKKCVRTCKEGYTSW